ncbi:MAG: S1C family serine protease [Candidatus Moraniibacteriota bacterium]
MKMKLIKIMVVFFLIMFFGWLGSLFFGRYLTPIFIKSKTFSKFEIFKNDNKNTTIINQTEKIVVQETESISEVASNASYSVVNIFSFERNLETGKKLSVAATQDKYLTGKRGVGTVLTNDGIIVTSQKNIILENADYKIFTLKGEVLPAQLLAVDNFSELAYLKVEGVNLTTMPFGDNVNRIFGKKVILIGQLSESGQALLAEGTMSGYQEGFSLAGGEVASSEKLEGVLKVAFDEDNQYVGGPVINYNGELLAITSKIEVDGREKYFQIPIETIKESVQKIIDNKITEVAKLGIYYVSVNQFYQDLKGLTVDRGAMIYSPSGKQGLAIIAGSPAEKAELKIGDIIVSIDGNEINAMHSLANFIYQYEKGSSATLNILRNGEMIEVEVVF